MAKKKTYQQKITAQVKHDHGGRVPEHLELTIENYARALEVRDTYADRLAQDGPVIIEVGSMGQQSTKQHPLCGILYQQEMLCLSYAKALGGTAAKAAARVESSTPTDKQPIDEYIASLTD